VQQSAPTQPNSPAPVAADSAAPASKRFPFPGETPDQTPAAPSSAAPNPNGLKDAGSTGDATKPEPGTSSSSSSSSSSSLPSDPNDPPDAPPIPHKSRRPLSTTKEPTAEEREAEDVSVAAFYMNTGDFKGAYMRGKDAVSLDDTDPEAHLALAEAARRLGKLDEAQQHYRRCLELDPVPKDSKVAEQALKQMSGKG
jgi:tetratricopeptide (TPR) repeat protein